MTGMAEADSPTGHRFELRKAAEAYFDRHELRPAVTELLVRLAKEQPPDPYLNMLQSLVERCKTDLSTLLHPQHEKPEKTEAVPAGEPAAQEKVSEDPGEERDTEESADVDALQLVLMERLPWASTFKGAVPASPQRDLSRFSRFGCGFNRGLLDGWVAQPSPCCAAASVAGAFNCLWRRGRGDPNSFTFRQCADLMAHHCDLLRQRRLQRLERLLGVHQGAVDEMLAALDQKLKERGLQWTGKEAVTKPVVMATIHEVLRERAAPPSAAPAAGEEPQAAVHDVFRALLDVLPSKPDPADVEGEDLPSAPSLSPEAAEEAEGLEETEVKAIAKGGFIDWSKELWDVITKRRGVLRLQAERPNTAAIGSWGVKLAAEDLAASMGETVRVRCLLGKKGSMKAILNPVLAGDGEAQVEQQWGALKTAFSRPNCVLLFHLTNHYALVFAWREWEEETKNPEELGAAQVRRQILTACKGQRPTAWLDFEEVRRIMISWSGYHLLQLERQGPQGGARTDSADSPGGLRT